MKSFPLFKTVDSLSLTPATARRLLHLLVGLFVLGLFCTCALYLWSKINSGVSCQRRLMNDAAGEMLLYFGRRQMLLERLGALVVRDSTLPKRTLDPHRQLPRYQHQWVALGEARSAWGVLLSGRDVADLDQMGAGLLYVRGDKRPVVSYLHGRFERRSMLPETVLDALVLEKNGADEEALWLAAPHDPLQRIYLFLAVRRDDEAIWLGLELRGSDLSHALASRFAGAYALQDAVRHVVLSSEGASVEGLDGCIGSEEAFGFCGNGLLPQFLILTKGMGPSGWRLSYYLPVERLLSPYWSTLVGCLLFWGGVALAVLGLAWRVDKRLIKPARMQLRDLLQHDEFLRTTLEVAPIALCLLRCSDAAVVLENRLARQWLGQGDGRHSESLRWIELARRASTESNSMEVQSANGCMVQLNFVSTRYKGEEVLFCACSDISARKQTERALREAREVLTSTRESKRLFLSAMNREVQAPLYRMLDFLACLRTAGLDRQQRSSLESMQRSVLNLQHLLNDIHNVSQLEEGRIVLEPREFSPSMLLRDIALAHAPDAHCKGVDLYVCCAPNMPEKLYGDVALIRQVLDNLLDNAVKFTDDGFIALRARLLEVSRGCQVIWQVSDTGCGIPAEQQPELFQPFFQVSGKGMAAPDGSGLGLTICHYLVQLLGGTLEVVSERGLGSSFAMCLPTQCPAEKNVVALAASQPVPVYIRCRPSDLSDALAGWLQRQGMQPRSWQVGHNSGAVLLECLLLGDRPLADRDWHGPRVIASVQEPDKASMRGRARQVSLYDMDAIGKAVRSAQELVVYSDLSNCYLS
ncbi:TPA: ATP-binding protein [Pseudomonas aeruginosa]